MGESLAPLLCVPGDGLRRFLCFLEEPFFPQGDQAYMSGLHACACMAPRGYTVVRLTGGRVGVVVCPQEGSEEDRGTEMCV